MLQTRMSTKFYLGTSIASPNLGRSRICPSKGHLRFDFDGYSPRRSSKIFVLYDYLKLLFLIKSFQNNCNRAQFWQMLMCLDNPGLIAYRKRIACKDLLLPPEDKEFFMRMLFLRQGKFRK